MAQLLVDGADLHVQLGRGEAFWAFHRSFRVPLQAVRKVRAPGNPWMELRGWRSAGVSFAGQVALGTRRHSDGYDFVALHGHEPAVIVELNGARFGWIVVSVADSARTIHDISAAAGIGQG